MCGKTATRKISGGAGLVFKGSGFYITDYGKDGKGPRKPGRSLHRRIEGEAGKRGQGGQAEPTRSPKSEASGKPAPSRGEGKAASE